MSKTEERLLQTIMGVIVLVILLLAFIGIGDSKLDNRIQKLEESFACHIPKQGNWGGFYTQDTHLCWYLLHRCNKGTIFCLGEGCMERHNRTCGERRKNLKEDYNIPKEYTYEINTKI